MASAFNNPFRDLKKTVKIPEKPVVQAKPVPLPPPPQEPVESEEEFFARQMLNVLPLKNDGRVRVTPPLPTIALRAQAEENEALAELSDLVAGRTDFDITDTDEYLEGTISGLDIRLVRKLRSGDFSRQAALDLHGMTSDAAHLEVENFILGAVRMGLRCVLIVHGRGRNSPGQIPVLKDRLKQWLTRAKIGRMVLAFATARPHDGGPGAMYVLLRRERGRKLPLIVLEGAKR
ncbi:MAG: DNA mismatch repair protein MutS [Deltaproteobacteria bacterium]|nr:DNA mismatch repair protein MutS [Deltaproteobacteria bacterium]